MATFKGFPRDKVDFYAEKILDTDDGILDCFGEIADSLKVQALRCGWAKSEYDNVWRAMMDEAREHALMLLATGEDHYHVAPEIAYAD